MAKKDFVAATSLKLGGKRHQPGDAITAEVQSRAGDKGMKAATERGQVMTRKDFDATQVSGAGAESLEEARRRVDAAEAKAAELEAKNAELAEEIEGLEAQLAAAQGGGNDTASGGLGV